MAWIFWLSVLWPTLLTWALGMDVEMEFSPIARYALGFVNCTGGKNKLNWAQVANGFWHTPQMSHELSNFVLSHFANNCVHLRNGCRNPCIVIMCWALLIAIEIRVNWIENGLQTVLTYTLCTVAGALLQLAFLKRLEESSGIHSMSHSSILVYPSCFYFGVCLL